MKTVTRFKILDAVCDEFEQLLLKNRESDGKDHDSNLALFLGKVANRAPGIPSDLLDENKLELLLLAIDYRIADGVSLQIACDELEIANDWQGIGEDLAKAKKTVIQKSQGSTALDSGSRLTPEMSRALRVHLPIEENLRMRDHHPEIEPTRLGRYEILKRVGAGGFGVVFQAFDPLMNRDVAIKIPRLSLVDCGKAKKLLQEETSALARLSHPGVVTAFHAEQFGEYFCLVSEFVPGENLQQWLESNSELSPTKVVKLVIQICDALEHAHGQGVIHRDLKPSNILVIVDGDEVKTKIADFGLARIFEGDHGRSTTFPGAGTLAYMSPERLLRRESTNFSCDIYSVGVIVFQLLTGQLPFEAENEIELVSQIIERQPPELRRVKETVSPELSAVVSKCLMKHPTERYQSISLLKADLECCARNEPVAAKRLGSGGKFMFWTRNRRRIPEAATFSIVLNVVLFLWSFAFIPIYYTFGLLDPVAIPSQGQLAASSALMVVLCCIPLCTGSFWILQGYTRWLLPTAVIAVFNLLLMLVLLSGAIEMDFGGLYRNPTTRMAALSLTATLMSFQVFLLFVAVYCDYYHRKLKS